MSNPQPPNDEQAEAEQAALRREGYTRQLAEAYLQIMLQNEKPDSFWTPELAIPRAFQFADAFATIAYVRLHKISHP